MSTLTRVDRNTFRSWFEAKPVAVADAIQQPGLRESPAMQRVLQRAAGADGILEGRAEVDKLYAQVERWFNDKPFTAFADRALYMKPNGATSRALMGLRVATAFGRPDPAAEAAGRSVVETTRRHHEQRAATGVGTHFGNASAFARLDDAGKEAYLLDRTRAGQTPPAAASLKGSSCIGWAMEHVGAWYKAAGRDARWQEVQHIVQQENMKGTTLARELQKDGWKTLYNNPDTQFRGPAGTPDNEHTYTHHIAKTQGTYYGIPVNGMVTDWESDPSRLGALERAPFFVHVARGGYHVTAGTRGQVNELAHSADPDSQVVYQDRMANIVGAYGAMFGGGSGGRDRALRTWGSGLTLVPPGTRL
jgi:hypothetical protein